MLILAAACRNSQRSFIAVNEVGYNIEDEKIALAVNLDSGYYEIEQVNKGVVVNQGQIELNYLTDPSSGDIVHLINFSELQEVGTYRIHLKSAGIRSGIFQVSENVYADAARKVLESFYYQRCGTEIDNGSRWNHPVCHPDDAVYYSSPGKRRDVTGGWHDAGDYNKFAITTTVSAGYLLYQFEHNPQYYKDGQLNHPDAGNDIPDLLDEIRWALKWLLKLQRDDGGIFFKVSQKKWTGEYLPQVDDNKRYIFRVNSNSTANFAAIAAIAARLYREFDTPFSDTLSHRAQLAWKFLEDHPVTVPLGGFYNPRDVSGGEYRDYNDTDERLWAAVELYRLTGKSVYHEYFLHQVDPNDGPGTPPISWKDVENFAYYAYLEIKPDRADGKIQQSIRGNLVEHADRLVERSADNRYRYVLNNQEYYWGSNSIAMGYAFDLIQAYRFTGNQEYLNTALDQLHYIMGRNPMQQSYITNVGFHSVENPYHQFSMLDGISDPVPGMLVGGPNNYTHLDGQISDSPAKNYEDREKNYMVNEPAINYTAALSYVIGYFANPVKDNTIVEEITK